MNSLSFIHSGSSANDIVLLEAGLEKDSEASKSNSTRRDRAACRWERDADMVLVRC